METTLNSPSTSIAPLSAQQSLNQNHVQVLRLALTRLIEVTKAQQEVIQRLQATHLEGERIRQVAVLNATRAVAARVSLDIRFWIVFLSLCSCVFFSALQFTAVSTILPAIGEEFGMSQYSYTLLGSWYRLTSCASVLLIGNIAGILGSKFTILGSISAPNIYLLAIGWSLQGFGGSGVLLMTEIFLVDSVELARRAHLVAIMGVSFLLACSNGPTLAGIFADANQWRWFYYMNIPACVWTVGIVLTHSDFKRPDTTWAEKRGLLDYTNILFALSASSTILGLTGTSEIYSWTSAAVLVPIIVGIAGMLLFVYLQKTYVSNPTLPFSILRHLTSLVGYYMYMLNGIVSMLAIEFLPIWFQAVRNDSASLTAIDLLSLSFTMAAFAPIVGTHVTVIAKYKILILVAWVFTIIGYVLFIFYTPTSNSLLSDIYIILLAVGLGINSAATYFPILSPIKISEEPQAVAVSVFSRIFGQILGITIGRKILSDGLKVYLPVDFISGLPGGVVPSNAFFFIPSITYLPYPLHSMINTAFSRALNSVWLAAAIISGVGLIASFFMQEISMKKVVEVEEQTVVRGATTQGIALDTIVC